MPRAARLAMLVLLAHAAPLIAQAWNAPAALALVHRAAERRLSAQGDSTLVSYRTRAHGFVFFLAQVGEGLTEPPRLVKADELRVEVYWRAPDRSKQVILGWRDGAFLPTDINYHRDHLGIVTNNFGNVIRIGEGDEVRDVPHPLSPAGLDRVRLRAGRLARHPHRRRARPWSARCRCGPGRSPGRSWSARSTSTSPPRSWCASASASPPPPISIRQLEDISIVLENSLFEQRYWLPYRQEIEIRRRTTMARLPRARHHPRPLGDRGLRPERAAARRALFTGPAIAGLTQPAPTDCHVGRAAQPGRGRGGRAGQPSRTWTRSGWRSSGSPGRGR